MPRSHQPSLIARPTAALRRRLALVKLVVFDFDGVFTDNGVWVFQDGREAVRCNRSDGLGVGFALRAGIDLAILSAETNPVVTARARKLKIDVTQGVEDKLSGLLAMLDDRGIDKQHTAYVGNDTNDLPCLEHVGLPIVVADAHPALLARPFARTASLGGHGAVREICDALLHARAA